MAQRTRLKLDIANPNAAGSDIGSASHFVAVPPDRDDEPVREFKSFTEDLERLADWLIACGIDTVAIADLLRDRRFQVRQRLDGGTIARYSRAMAAGK